MDLEKLYIDDYFKKMIDFISEDKYKIVDLKSKNIDYYFGYFNIDINTNVKKGILLKDYKEQIENFEIENIYFYKDNLFTFYRNINYNNFDFTFVIQGIDYDITIISLCFLFLNGKIIISTWNNYNFKDVEKYVHTNKICNSQNVYYQVYSTLEGLKKVKTKYAIKVRSDEIWLDFSNYLKVMYENQNKITVSNIFLRNSSSYAYHISDHIIGGDINNLLKMFENLKKILDEKIVLKVWNFKNAPEQFLAISYLSSIYGFDNFNKENSVHFLKLHFKSVDVNSFKKFSIRYSPNDYRENILIDLFSIDNLS
jgi:hypothetical protein